MFCKCSTHRGRAAATRAGTIGEFLEGLALFRGSQHHVAGSSGEIRALEQRVEAVLAIEPNRDFRSLLRCAGGDERDGASGADVRFHRGARACSAAGAKGGKTTKALGRSRGGFSTRIAPEGLISAACRWPFISPAAKPATVATSRSCSTRPDITPRAAITRQGIRCQSQSRWRPPTRHLSGSSRTNQTRVDRPVFFPKALYKARARIEQAVGKLKRLQAHRTPMREDRAQLRLFRRAGTRLHLDQIRPQT